MNALAPYIVSKRAEKLARTVSVGAAATADSVSAAIATMDATQTATSQAALEVSQDGPGFWLGLQARNAPTYLTIPTYEGSNQPVHPSVLFVPDGFAGKKWWMAMTPYPGSDSTKENPSILCSDDGLTWAAPSGVTNPLVAYPGSGDYNADPHLIIVNGTMIITYRWYDASETQVYHRYITSTDGVTWTAPAEMFDYDTATRNEVAPSLHWDGSAYHWWAYETVGNNIVYRTAATLAGLGAATPTICTINNDPRGTNFFFWHPEVVFHGGCYVMLVQCARTESAPGSALWLGVSTDKTTFTMAPQPTLVGATHKTGLWDRKLYKSALVPNLKTPVIYYGGWATGNLWHVGRAELLPVRQTLVPWDGARVKAASTLVGASNYTRVRLADLVDRADSNTSPGAPTAATATALGTITHATRASNVATITLAANHNIRSGSIITVDCSDDTFDGTDLVVTTTGATTLSYANTGADSDADATGTVTAKYQVYASFFNGIAGVSGNRLYWVSGAAPGAMVQYDAGSVNVELECLQDGSASEVFALYSARQQDGNPTQYMGFLTPGEGTLSFGNQSEVFAVTKGIQRQIPERWKIRFDEGLFFTVWYNGIVVGQHEMGSALVDTLVGIRMQSSGVRVGEILVTTVA